MRKETKKSMRVGFSAFVVGLLTGGAMTAVVMNPHAIAALRGLSEPPLEFGPRGYIDTSGFSTVTSMMQPWSPQSSLQTIRQSWDRVGYRGIEEIDQFLKQESPNEAARVGALITKSTLWNYEGEPAKAYALLGEAREMLKGKKGLAAKALGTVVYFQGITALRQGETENCIECRGESSCILPISEAARHLKPEGSHRAIKHFTEYLELYPDDLEVRWLLNLAHMTLGEHPDKVDPRYLISLEKFEKSEFDIGRFRDIGHLLGLNRLNQAGGAVMDDFDNDGLLDLVVTCWDATMPTDFYRNAGDGTFEQRTQEAGLSGQLGGLTCFQADYNNDGFLDLYIPRGAWLPYSVRPTLLQGHGDGTFTDVTKEARLLDPISSNGACWGDFDNDGFVDLFVCCEQQPNRLYRNKGDETFEDVAAKAGLYKDAQPFCKGANWIDIDNDDYPDLFTNNLNGVGQLFQNNRDGTFTDVSQSLGIDGPRTGFSCWAFDYDNDGWLDLFATCYERTLATVVKGLQSLPHNQGSNRLFRNTKGTGFVDVTKEAGLDLVFSTMGSNYGDFDNDGFLDFYLATGEPNLGMLVPNRMFKNVSGQRFAEITGSSGTGHLQKGHGVACGDWDRDGDLDLFVEMGGATNGDKYHNIMFQNPGQGNHSLTVKLVGKKTNRSAIGARIKVVTDGESPLTVHRHVSTGSSFGANPLEQTIGLARAQKVAILEIHWPTSGITQVFRDIPADQIVEITEFADDYTTLTRKPIPTPE